ncbi:Asp23/Gls24 family envelope stress response protein [Streptomyces sp. SID12501]|uniref:Asp23/Gls24 family envelope stress response protein n=1 Tax=Streptomyces sp. SID12501 TaxID=2706042 RepID=A0A6B3BGD6_9ACTN|nr:Asp23/Gls24 family envelope stress response protein [Streptomyces sp. SID12501]NEC84840.1 Asp23/Gls24 family envelope stress response protein [Streptomyces sp. SID12501]
MTDRTEPPNNASTHADDDELLPCGRLLSRTWNDWEQRSDGTDYSDDTGGTDSHLRSCPYCSQAVSGLDRLESVVRGLQEETDTAAYDAGPLTRRVMDVVRLELRPGRPLPLGEPAEDLWIMEAVAARALRAAAETVAGVRAGSCRLFDAPADAHSDACSSSHAHSDTSADGAVGVRLDIHAPADVSLPDLAARVRERVREAAYRELGMVVAAVDIRVTDLLHTPADDGQEEGRTP